MKALRYTSDEDARRYREWLDKPPTAWGDDDIEGLLVTRNDLLIDNSKLRDAITTIGKAWDQAQGQKLSEAVRAAQFDASESRELSIDIRCGRRPVRT